MLPEASDNSVAADSTTIDHELPGFVWSFVFGTLQHVSDRTRVSITGVNIRESLAVLSCAIDPNRFPEHFRSDESAVQHLLTTTPRHLPRAKLCAIPTRKP